MSNVERAAWAVIFDEVEDLKLQVQEADAVHRRDALAETRARNKADRSAVDLARLEVRLSKSQEILAALVQRDRIGDPALKEAHVLYVKRNGKAVAA